VRAGLGGQTAARAGKPFRVHARRLGLRSGLDAGTLNRFADEIESEEVVDARKTRR
jgi:hypothetical protein